MKHLEYLGVGNDRGEGEVLPKAGGIKVVSGYYRRRDRRRTYWWRFADADHPVDLNAYWKLSRYTDATSGRYGQQLQRVSPRMQRRYLL